MKDEFDIAISDIETLFDTFINLEAKRSVLEKELQVLRLKIRQAEGKLDERVHDVMSRNQSEDAKAKLREVFNRRRKMFSELSPSEKSRLKTALAEYEQTKEWKLTVAFDLPRLLQIIVRTPNSKPRVVDIISSIRADISNLWNPIILAAVERYRRTAAGHRPKKEGRKSHEHELPISAEMAYQALERISDAVRFNLLDSLAKSKQNLLTKVLETLPFDPDLFDYLATILNSASVRNLGTVSNKLSQTRLKLRKKYPEVEFVEILEWLEHRMSNKRLPKRLDQRTLTNDFVAWKWNIGANSAKVYLSETRRLLKISPENPLSETEIQDLLDQSLKALWPIVEMPGETKMSGLVYDVKAETSISNPTSQPPVKS